MAMEHDPGTPSPNSLRSSPAARAFFAALDEVPTDEDVAPANFTKKIPFSSSSIRKRISTLGWRNRYSQTERYPIQIRNQTFSVLQVQRGEVEGTYGTGATVWPASIVLVKYLQRHCATLIEDKRIVDLGAGTGVTTIAAAILGASHCICTDGESAVVRLAHDNIQYAAQELQNGDVQLQLQSTFGLTAEDEAVSRPSIINGCMVDVQEYWWGSGRISGCDTSCCDVILVSDCVLPKLYPIAPLVEALHQLLVSTTAIAILSYEHRYYPEYDPRDKFRELCHSKNLIVTTIPMEEQDPVYSVDDIEIWHVQRKS